MAFNAAAWMLTSSIRAMKSRTLPPCLHSLKQFQMFLLMLTRNCVGLLPLWIGHGPLRLSRAPLELVQEAVVLKHLLHGDGRFDGLEVNER